MKIEEKIWEQKTSGLPKKEEIFFFVPKEEKKYEYLSSNFYTG